MLKKETKVVKTKGLNYVVGSGGKPLRITPWLGDSFSFLYDFIMRESIFSADNVIVPRSMQAAALMPRS